MKRGKVLQFAQWCHALEVLGKQLKSTSKTRKMRLASGRVKHVGRGRYRLIDGVENRAPKKSAKPGVCRSRSFNSSGSALPNRARKTRPIFCLVQSLRTCSTISRRNGFLSRSIVIGIYSFPLYSQLRTCRCVVLTDTKCQNRTHAAQQEDLLDHLAAVIVAQSLHCHDVTTLPCPLTPFSSCTPRSSLGSLEENQSTPAAGTAAAKRLAPVSSAIAVVRGNLFVVT